MGFSEFITELGRPVSYYPVLARLIGVKECVFVCQLLYWHKNFPDREEFYKSAEELTEEIGMSYDEQVTVRKSLVKKGVLNERYARLEHKMYFSVDKRKLDEIWEAGKSIRGGNFAKAAEPISRNGQCQVREDGNAHSVINGSETTPETTLNPKASALPAPQGEPSIKSKVEVSERGMAFADWFKTTLPDDYKFPSRWREKWAKCFDDMIRLDNRTELQITKVCKWARADSFWATNFLTPLKLRDKKHGVMYFDTFLAKSNEKKATPTNHSDRNAGTFNAGRAQDYAGIQRLSTSSLDPDAKPRTNTGGAR